MPPTPTVVLQSSSVPLSGRVKLMVQIHGTANEVRVVEWPEFPLSDEAREFWQITPLGLPQLQETSSATQFSTVRWSRDYEITPLIVGPTNPLGFLPMKIDGQAVAVPNTTVEVTSLITQASPQLARPLARLDVPRTPESGLHPGVMIAAVVMGLALVALLSSVWTLLTRKRVPTLAELWAELRAELNNTIAHECTLSELQQFSQRAARLLALQAGLNPQTATPADLLHWFEEQQSEQHEARAAWAQHFQDVVQFSFGQAPPTSSQITTSYHHLQLLVERWIVSAHHVNRK